VDRDLPVALELPPHLAGEVAAYVEGELGWQVVGLEGPPRPALVLAGAPLAGLPTVVVVDGEADAQGIRAGWQGGALDVLSWPAERDRLGAVPARAAAPATAAGGPPLLRVAGAAGGVGTSTVTLALAGLLAWAGRDVVVLGGDDLLVLAGLAPWRGPGAPEIGMLDARDAASEVAALARAVPGVRGLRVLGGQSRASLPPPVSAWPVDVVVADLGAVPGAACDVRCARPDVHLTRIGGARAPLALVGEGPLPPRAVRKILGGDDPAVWLPMSARVARAAARGRVPADLPGTWLRALRALLGSVRLPQRG
jgi:hypothetical protein